jgi:hypothetical protein
MTEPFGLPRVKQARAELLDDSSGLIDDGSPIHDIDEAAR